MDLLQTITMEIAAAIDLSSALQIVLRRVCEKTGWALGQAWLPDSNGAVLNLGPGCYCGNGELNHFRAICQSTQFEPGIGLPGRVWQSKQPAWIQDVATDPNFPRFAAALAAGLKTGVAIPIISGDKVIAILEFFTRESREQNVSGIAGAIVLLRRTKVSPL